MPILCFLIIYKCFRQLSNGIHIMQYSTILRINLHISGQIKHRDLTKPEIQMYIQEVYNFPNT